MDAELVRRAKADDRRAFEDLVCRHARSMLQLADFVLHDRAAAEDALQEAYLAAWKRRETLRDEAAFFTWFRRIVLRECLRWRRRPLWRAVPLSDRVQAPPPRDHELHLDIARAVGRLSPKLRAVIFLHYYQDVTLATLAEVLRVPESTAKSRLYEALRRMERLLPAYAGEASKEEAQ